MKVTRTHIHDTHLLAAMLHTHIICMSGVSSIGCQALSSGSSFGLIYIYSLLLLLRPGKGAEHCNQFVCVREHISGTTGPIITHFCADPLWSLLGPLVALRYVVYF